MKTFATLVLAASGAMSAAVPAAIERRFTGSDLKYGSATMNSAAYNSFLTADIKLAVDLDAELNARQETLTEPDANRGDANPDLIYVLQCTDAGFRGDCTVFGTKPGKCVSYFNFQPANSTEVSDTFNDKVTSLSSNTGGQCQFFKYKGCNDKGDDRGLTSSYNYNLAVALPDDPRTIEYDNQITSWRC